MAIPAGIQGGFGKKAFQTSLAQRLLLSDGAVIIDQFPRNVLVTNCLQPGIKRLQSTDISSFLLSHIILIL
ncbi:MAG: hypothetical protein GKR99_19140 [Rhodobacteraceae bacterium]|nr:hypothetical protein [Paracoccaceae bacterium]